MGKPKILAFAGSLRKDSFNKKVVRVASAAAQAAGAEVTLVDLADYPMPVYDGDLEEREGLPEKAREFKKLMISHQGFLISTPEYNSSIPGAFKNVIDWASRTEEDEPPLAAFTGKTAGLMSASPGILGGMRSLAVLRSLLENIGVLVIPKQMSVSRAHEAFAEDGSLKDAKQKAGVEAVAGKLVEVLKKLNS